MRIATLAIAALLAIAQSAAAADGIQVRFHLEQQARLKSGASDTRTYDNAFLFAFGEKAVGDFDGVTKIVFEAADQGDTALLHLALSIYDGGTEKYIGAGDLAVKLGGAADLLLTKDDKTYLLRVWPSKAPLPLATTAPPAPAPVPAPAPAATSATPAPAAAPLPSGPLTLTPLTTPKIQLPDDACRQRLSGFVTLEFAVMPDGTVANAHAVESDPKGVFDAAAIAAVTARTYPPQAKPVKMREKIPLNFADCRVEQLHAAAPVEATAESQGDCLAIAQQAQALGEQIGAGESGRGLLEGKPAQIYSAPSDHCSVAGKTLKFGGKLVSHIEYKGFSLVSKAKDQPEAAVWVRSNALKDVIP